LKKGVTVVLIVVCVAIFGISAYQLLNYYGADRAAESGFADLLPPDLAGSDVEDRDGISAYEILLPYYERLREQNGDMVGWLRIPGTRVSYPVMQTKNSPEFYLDRNFEKNYSASGSLFAADISDVDRPSEVVIIYGHRMKTGAMFGSLGDFLKEDFLLEHDRVIFDTFTERNEYKIYMLFSLAVGPEIENEFDYFNYNGFSDMADFNSFIARARAHADIENPANMPQYGDKILLLSTCEYTHENGRLVMICVRQ